jgi:tetratricopeptide (TPR) repeat protein
MSVVVHSTLTSTRKTQCALEFCWKTKNEPDSPAVYWVTGRKGSFAPDYNKIAAAANLKVDTNNEEASLEAVQAWLESNTSPAGRWLLVIDGADDSDLPEFKFLPRTGGQILFTGRSEELVTRFADPADGIHIGKMSSSEAREMFLLLSLLPDTQEARATKDLIHELENLPLAILQAATFLRHARLPAEPVSWYLQHFQSSRSRQAELLSKFRKTPYYESDMSSSVMTTWKITFDYMKEKYPTAAALLGIMANFNPHAIPLDLLMPKERSNLLSELLEFARQQISNFLSKEVETIEALGHLQDFSFLTPCLNDTAYEIHRLVRLATLTQLEEDLNTTPFTQAALFLCLEFPPPILGTVNTCSRLLPHVTELIELSEAFCKPVDTLRPQPEHCHNEMRGLDARGLVLNLQLMAIKSLRLQGRVKQALAMGEEALEYRRAALGKLSRGNYAYTIELYHTLSLCMLDLKKYDQAFDLGEMTYQRRLEIIGPEHRDTLQSLNHLGWIEAYSPGKTEKAIETFGKVLEQTKGNEALLDIEIEAMRGLSVARNASGQLQEAFALLVQIVERQRSIHGEDSPEVALTVSNIAKFQFTRFGARREAALNLEGVLPSLLKFLGRSHPETLTAIYQIASYYLNYDKSKLDRAEFLFRRLVESDADSVLEADMDPLEMCDGLADVLKAKGNLQDLEEGVCLMKAVVNGCEKRKGSQHPRTQQALQDLQDIEDRWKKAKRMIEENAAAGGDEPNRSAWLLSLGGERDSL